MQIIGNELFFDGYKVAILAEKSIPATVREEFNHQIKNWEAEDYEELEAECASLEGDLSAARSELEEADVECSRLRSENEQLEKRVAELEAELKKLKAF